MLHAPQSWLTPFTPPIFLRSIVNEDDIVCPSNLVKLVSKYDDDNWHFIFVTLFLLIGIAQVAILYGHLGLLLQSKYQASAAFRMKLDRVKTECKYYKVPWDLQNRVYAYYDYLWVNQKQYDDKIMLMNDRGMSSDLRGKLALFLYKDVIQGVTLFERVDDTFLSKICMELQTRIYLPEDWVITKGDIGSELYIISRGVVQVFIVDANELIEQGVDEETARKKAEDGSIFLHRGNFFGEVSLLMETRRTTGVQAKTVCELNVLVQEVFEEILRESPEFAEEMKNLVLERKLHNAKTGASNKTKKNVGEGNASVLHSVSFGHTVENIEAAVVDAIESRQLVTNMRHAANFDDEDIEHAPEISATSDLDEIVSQRSHRNSFIKPIQDQIDKEKKERSAGRRASMDAVAEESKEESSADENPDNGNLEGIAGELRAEILEEHQNRQQAQSAPGQPPGSGSPHRGSFSQGRRGSRRALGFTRGMSGRRDSMRSEASVDMENRANQLSEQARVMQDVISMQVATLQERTDKVYAMLTTKLGRVR
jgi:CRP-like cAMP-binding protein